MSCLLRVRQVGRRTCFHRLNRYIHDHRYPLDEFPRGRRCGSQLLWRGYSSTGRDGGLCGARGNCNSSARRGPGTNAQWLSTTFQSRFHGRSDPSEPGFPSFRSHSLQKLLLVRLETVARDEPSSDRPHGRSATAVQFLVRGESEVAQKTAGQPVIHRAGAGSLAVEAQQPARWRGCGRREVRQGRDVERTGDSAALPIAVGQTRAAGFAPDALPNGPHFEHVFGARVLRRSEPSSRSVKERLPCSGVSQSPPLAARSAPEGRSLCSPD